MPKAEALAASWKMTTEVNLISVRTVELASSKRDTATQTEDFSGGYMCENVRK